MLNGRYSFNDRLQRISGQLLFIVILIYACVYAWERTSYVDNAWIFFQQVNNCWFAATLERLPAAIPEAPLYLGVKLGFSLHVLVYIFSLSYISLTYIIWLLCTFYFRNATAGWIVVLGTFMGIRELFVHSVTEMHQAMAYSGLLYAVLFHQFRTVQTRYLITILVTCLAIWVHPLGVFTCGFVAAFYYADKKNIKDGILLTVILIITIVACYNFLSPPNAYDKQHYEQLSVSTKDLIDSGVFRFIRIQLAHFYWLPLVAMIVAICWLITKKDILRVSLFAVGISGYLLIAGASFSNGDSSIMIERLLLPALFMINVVLAIFLVNINATRKWTYVVFVLFIFINGIRFINIGCLMYKKRTAYLDELVQKAIAQGNDKYVLTDATTDKEKIIIPWALGTETLLYSKFKYDQCVSISMKDESCQPTEVRITGFMCLPVNDLNPNYFKLSDNPYSELK